MIATFDLIRANEDINTLLIDFWPTYKKYYLDN